MANRPCVNCGSTKWLWQDDFSCNLCQSGMIWDGFQTKVKEAATRFKENMNRYYNTMSPDAARHILRQTEDEAIEDAKQKVAEDGRPRYVVKILAKIEKDVVPTKVTRYAVSED